MRNKKNIFLSSMLSLRAYIIVLFFLITAGSVWMLDDLTVLANDQKVMDLSDLLTDKEEAALQKRLIGLSEKYQCDVIAATTDSFDGKDRWDYTEEFFLQNDYGYGDSANGIIFVVNLPERQFQYLTRGEAEYIFTDYGLEIMDNQVTPYLSDGEYYDAFRKYADLAGEFLQEAQKDRPYDVGHTYKEKMSTGTRTLIALGAGAAAALITILVLLGQLKTVRVKGQAQEYVREGSFRVTGSRDLYLYRTVSRRKIERDQSGGSGNRSSSGGGRSGGRGGSF